MIYHGLDDELISFALDPIKYKKVLGVNSRPIVRAINYCRNVLLPYKTDIEEFEEFLFDTLALAEEQILQIRKTPPTGEYDGNEEKSPCQIKDYLRMLVAVSEDKASNKFYKSAIYDYIDRQIVTTFNYHVDRISECYKIKREFLLLVDSSVLISSMILSEVYVLVKADYISVRKLKGGFVLELKGSAEPYRRAHGLSELLEDKSSTSDKSYLVRTTSLMDRNCISPELANVTIDQVFDKILSIKPKYLSEAAKSSSHYQFIRECVAIMTFAECFKLRGFDVPVSFFVDNKLCRHESLRFIISHLQELNTVKGNNFNILTFDGSSFILGNLEFKLATRHLVYVASSLIGKDENVKEELIKFGDIFEKDYIYQYLQNLDMNRYKVYPSITPNNNAEIKGYDIDLVIEDKLFEQFYFVQVKYRTKWLPKFFSERYWELTTGLLKDYERQLRVFKNNLNHSSIRKKLSQQKYKGLERATDENSHFVFLHNLPFLNFYEFDGIYFYEWNLFRNMMQGAKVYWTQGDMIGAEARKAFSLHDTTAAIESYISDDQTKTSLGPDLDTYINSLVQLKVKTRFKNTFFDIPLI